MAGSDQKGDQMLLLKQINGLVASLEGVGTVTLHWFAPLNSATTSTKHTHSLTVPTRHTLTLTHTHTLTVLQLKCSPFLPVLRYI